MAFYGYNNLHLKVTAFYEFKGTAIMPAHNDNQN